MKPMKRTTILLILAVLVVGAAVGAFFLLGDREPEKEAQRQAAVQAAERDTRRVSLYFMRVENGQEEPVSVSRDISTEGGVEVSALEALLKGPLPDEREKDYFSSIPEGVEVEEFELQAGRAYVSFSAEMDKNVAGSARVQAIREQIRLTLRQFEQIEAVEIAVEGQTEGILQP